MPLLVTCSGCQTKMRVPEQFAGKTIKCPKCGEGTRAVASDSTDPAPATSQSPAAIAPATEVASPPVSRALAVTCAACDKKLQVKAELAGKTVRCPGCGKGVKVPAPAAPTEEEEEWLDVNEEAEPAPAASRQETKGPSAAGDWGQELLNELGVVQQIQDEIQEELSRSERIVWATRPRQDILMYQARKVGFVVGPIIFTIGILVMAAAVKGLGPTSHGAVAVKWAIAGVGMLVGSLAFLMPFLVARGAPRRACYVLTNRRLIVHKGKGARVFVGRSGADDAEASLAEQHQELIHFNGLELASLARLEDKKFKGTGELCVGRSIYQDPVKSVMQAIDDVQGVEKMIREQLLHPIVDRLLRGEVLSKAEKNTLAEMNKTKEGEEASAVPLKSNLKGRTGTADRRSKDQEASKSPFARLLKKVSARDRETVEAELTEGEEILWIGEPVLDPWKSGMFPVRGEPEMFQVVIEPDYWLYALTNRRVIVWIKKKAPLSYYSPGLLCARLEEDTRDSDVGSIVLRRVIVETRGSNNFNTLHTYGILRVENYRALAMLLHDTLIAPCRGL